MFMQDHGAGAMRPWPSELAKEVGCQKGVGSADAGHRAHGWLAQSKKCCLESGGGNDICGLTGWNFITDLEISASGSSRNNSFKSKREHKDRGAMTQSCKAGFSVGSYTGRTMTRHITWFTSTQGQAGTP